MTATDQKATGNPLATDPIGKLVGRYAIPGIISLLVNSLYNIVDQIFIGQSVGYLGNAATNVVMPVTLITIALAVMLGDGGAAFMSLNMGRSRRRIAARGCGNVIVSAIAVGLGISSLFLGFLRPLCRLFGSTEAVMPYAVEYGRIIALGFPFVVLSIGLNSLLRADGQPRAAMKAMIAGAVTNVILDALFIFGFHWGVAGAAWATVAGQLLTCGISVFYTFHFRSVALERSHFRLKREVIRTILSFGVSGFITQTAIMLVIVVCNNLIRTYGPLSVYGADIPLATFGITLKMVQIIISLVLGLSLGCQPILGYNYGAGNYGRVRNVFLYEVRVAVMITGIATLFFLFFPRWLVGIFGSESELYNEFAVKSIRIFLMLTMLNGFQVIGSMFFQSTGKPLRAAVLSVSRQVVFLIPAAVILCRIIGLEGVLWSGPVADMLAFLLTLALIVPELKRLKAMG